MASKTTIEELKALVNRINDLTGNDRDPCRHLDGKTVWSIGSYSLTGAYGGHGLEQVANESGGVRSIIGGYLPKRDLADRMRSFIAGLQAKD